MGDAGGRRLLLVAARLAASVEAADLEDEVGGIITGAASTLPDDEHDAEGSTLGYERARAGALLDHTRARIAALDRALVELDDGVERGCRACGAAIGAERLAALPAARRCVACAAPPGRSVATTYRR